MTARTPRTPRLDLISIVTDDLAASLAFYRRLGIDVAEGAENQPHVEATLPGGLRFAWDTVETIRSFMPDWAPVSGAQRIGIAFRCADAADVDTLYAELTAAGHVGEKAPWDAFWGQRYAVVKDPDGNGVDLFAPLDQ
ncbi:VOC family protein [Streptomyces hainanensis]|uniref:Glyoxalase n=1 Tax=Streptomyces hainanensis TaxID=402648 RepID=A0A4R4TLM0_9ACTN|nr:VOC family protein [Streptomyces hainanensis]TDC76202.1 glyoxalase [Streptomyces hainanensis]